MIFILMHYYYTGAYIANRVSDKITPIHDRIFVCRSGSAADTQAIADYVRYYLDMHRYAWCIDCLMKNQVSDLSPQC